MTQTSPPFWIRFKSLHGHLLSGRYQQDLNKMAASHDRLLRVSSSPGQLQMSCASDFIALPLTKTIVGVWWAGDLTRKVYCIPQKIMELAFFLSLKESCSVHDSIINLKYKL